MRKLNVLLVGPDYRSATGWTTPSVAPGIVVDIAPLVLSTLAALAPEHVHVDIWDEPVHGRITPETKLEREYDFVGVTGYSAHQDETLRIGRIFKEKGALVGVGGPGVSTYPDLYRHAFDVLFIGEAEEIWPAFLLDLAEGRHKGEYRQIWKPELDKTPRPDWRKLDMSKYGVGTIQTTRGCPFDCEFCDVIYLFGRRIRHRPIEKVTEELRAMAGFGMDTVYFSDDEFVGDKRYTKELLRAIGPVNQGFERPMALLTQSTVNAAHDDELLELLADAGFAMLFVGIESVDPEALRNMGKIQNLKSDLLADVRRVLSHGIALRGNTIVGFDEDDTSAFDRLFAFHQAACIPLSAVTTLMAPHGTRLWSRLREEGRLVLQTGNQRSRFDPEQGRYQFNIVPLRMTRIELLAGYRDLLLKLYDWKNVVARNRGFLEGIKRPPRIEEEPLSEASLRYLLEVLEARANLDAEGKKAVLETADIVREIAPFMWRKMKLVLSMQANMRSGIHSRVAPSLERQIEYEKREGPPKCMPASKPPAPRAFRQHFRQLFPDVYRRVSWNLKDKTRVAEAVTEVFVDFLIRWGETFTDAEPHHAVFLAELCDRACAKYNGIAPEDFVPITESDEVLPDARRMRLGDDILRNIDVELGFEQRRGLPVVSRGG